MADIISRTSASKKKSQQVEELIATLVYANLKVSKMNLYTKSNY